MALDPALHFPDIGVYVRVRNSLTEKLEDFKDDVVGAVEQLDSDFERVSILPSFISNMTAAANSISTGDANVVAASTTYHTQILAAELPSSQPVVSGVITDFFAAMVSGSETFLDGGAFDLFYQTAYSRNDVPVAPSGSNTVNDNLAK